MESARMVGKEGSPTDLHAAAQITLDELTVSKGGLPPPVAPPLRVIGWRAFQLLVGFVGLSLAALAVFAWSTYPSLPEVMAAMAEPAGPVVTSAQPCEVAGPDAASLWSQARTEWLAGIKELGQMFVLTPLLPLLGTVLGYIFGREQGVSKE